MESTKAKQPQMCSSAKCAPNGIETTPKGNTFTLFCFSFVFIDCMYILQQDIHSMSPLKPYRDSLQPISSPPERVSG